MESFRECGWASFVALGFGGLATIVSVVALAFALIKPRIGLLIGVVALAVALSPAGIGFLGLVRGRQQTDAVIDSYIVELTPKDVERLRAAGYSEAAQCVAVGTTISVFPMILAGIAIAVGAAKKASEKKA